MNKANAEPLSVRLAVMLAALVAIGPFAIDTYLPALPTMAQDFSTTSASLQLSISCYFLGAALGQVFGGPLSDSCGRKPVAVIGLIIFMVCSALISLSTSVVQILALRFCQALGGGATVVISSAVVRDRYQHKQQAAQMLSMISMIMLMAPLVAPGFGALVLAFSHWRLIFLFLALYSSVLLLMVVFYLPETLARRTQEYSRKDAVLKGYARVLQHGKAMGFIFCIGFALIGLFTFLTTSPFTYMEYFGISPNIYPLLFGSNIIIYMLLNRLNMRLLNQHDPVQLIPLGIALQLMSSALLTIYVLSQEPRLETIFLLMLLDVCSISFIAANATSCALRYFPDISGTANAVIGTLNFGFAGVAGIVASMLHDGSLVPMALTMLVGSVLAFFALLVGLKLPEPAETSGHGKHKVRV